MNDSNDDSLLSAMIIEVLNDHHKKIYTGDFYIENQDLYIYCDFTEDPIYENTDYYNFIGYFKEFTIKDTSSENEMIVLKHNLDTSEIIFQRR